MKKKGILSLIFAVFVTFIGGCGETISTERGETVFGTFSTIDSDGNPVNEQIFGNEKLTMVNIWATFCSPCVEEMSELSQLKKEFNQDFQIVGMVADAADKNGNILLDKKEEVLRIIEVTQVDYRNLFPSRSLNKAYLDDVQSVPETIFVDENGKQIGEKYFGAKNKTEWKAIVEALLESME